MDLVVKTDLHWTNNPQFLHPSICRLHDMSVNLPIFTKKQLLIIAENCDLQNSYGTHPINSFHPSLPGDFLVIFQLPNEALCHVAVQHGRAGGFALGFWWSWAFNL